MEVYARLKIILIVCLFLSKQDDNIIVQNVQSRTHQEKHYPKRGRNSLMRKLHFDFFEVFLLAIWKDVSASNDIKNLGKKIMLQETDRGIFYILLTVIMCCLDWIVSLDAWNLSLPLASLYDFKKCDFYVFLMKLQSYLLLDFRYRIV